MEKDMHHAQTDVIEGKSKFMDTLLRALPDPTEPDIAASWDALPDPDRFPGVAELPTDTKEALVAYLSDVEDLLNAIVPA
jgi:hypothetical protein